jgi:hypothetical protein
MNADHVPHRNPLLFSTSTGVIKNGWLFGWENHRLRQPGGIDLPYQPGLKFVQVIRPFLGPRIPSSEEGFPFLLNGSSMKFNRIS